MEMEKREYTILQNMLYVLKGVWRYQKALMFLLIISAFCGAFSQYIWVIIPKIVIDQIENKVQWQELLKIVIFISALQLVFTGLSSYTKHAMGWRYNYISMRFILNLNKKQNTMDYEFLENPRILDQSRLADHGTRSIEGMLQSINTTSIQGVKILLSIAIIFTLNPLLILLVVLLSFIYYTFLNLTIEQDKLKSWDPLAPMWRKIWYTRHVNKNFEYAKDVRLYDMSQLLMDKQKEVNAQAHKLVANSKTRWIKFGTFYNTLTMLLELTLYVVLIYYVLNKGLSIGNFVFYLATIKTFSAALNAVLYSIASIKNQSREINDYRTFVAHEVQQSPLLLTASKSLASIKSFRFEFVDVSFKYPGQENFALKNMNIVLEDKTRLAIVGLNGAGKTTFIKLLLRLYDPTEGTILLDGIDVKEFDKDAYYTLFAPLFQNIELFAFPLSENVTMKTPAATDKQKASRALYLAGLSDKLATLEKGVDTELLKFLHDDGIDLSGGEKQKLALARALYKDAPVVVLDEPTSALDALAEYSLYQNFDKIVKHKTAIYISHRLSSTRFCDTIAMFDNGQMIESGTHDQLLKINGAYKNMFDLQARYYQDKKEDLAYGKQ